MYKRIRVLSIITAVIMGLLVMKLAYIQILGHEDLSAAAETQQNIVLDGADTRGVIYDRNGTPIAGGHQEYIYIIRAENYDGETQNALNKMNAETIVNENKAYKVFSSQSYNKKIGERLIKNSDAYIMEVNRRYTKDQPAVHMIGYINSKDSSGESGLELMCDRELNQLQKRVSAVADVNGNLLQGYGLNVNAEADTDIYVKYGIFTTLDLRIQKKIENILAENEKNGAIIVSEVKTGAVVAAASTPVFDPEKIDEYIESQNSELVNKVTQGLYPPGSVFKIIVAAAALEAGIDADMELECTGSENVNGHVVNCETGGESGHGKITFTKAFADSCNSAFIQLGKMTGADEVIAMAERFGLGETVLDGFPEEQQGHIMSRQESEGAAITNLSIGQGETLVTPLQVCAITTIVANGGINPGIKIIKENNTEGEVCIADNVAVELQNMMEETMISGTGAGLELPVSSGGKTGSAESTQGGKEVVHGWITGYVPADKPEYTITVFVEDGKSGRGSAGPMFAETAAFLDEKNLLIYETDV